MESRCLLEEGKSVFSKDVAPGRCTMLRWEAPHHEYIFEQHKVNSVGFPDRE